MGEGRNVYLEPRERFVLRTQDVYQDELDDDVTGYSDTVLALVANYDNGGAPEGYELAELDGEYVLVQVDPDALPQRRPIRCEGVALLMGAYGYYLYDTAEMTGAYARWAFLAAEDDPLVAFVYCVREESRVYPRPMAIESFGNEPFSFDAATVEALYEQAAGCDDYADIGRTEASNGDVYFYSAEHLSATQAAALAEWHSVERLRNL